MVLRGARHSTLPARRSDMDLALTGTRTATCFDDAPETATAADPDDGDVVAAVAAVVGTRRRLALLAALTEADARAVGERAWTDWRAQLVGQFAERVAARLGVTLGAAHP